MSQDAEKRAILHSLFDLREGVAEDEFVSAFKAYVAHLVQMGFALSGRVMRRKPLEGFGAPLPGFAYYAAIEFPDLQREQACYDYVARASKPVRTVHMAMNRHVRPGTAHFFVSFDVGG
jgi:hypothetical protein